MDYFVCQTIFRRQYRTEIGFAACFSQHLSDLAQLLCPYGKAFPVSFSAHQFVKTSIHFVMHLLLSPYFNSNLELPELLCRPNSNFQLQNLFWRQNLRLKFLLSFFTAARFGSQVISWFYSKQLLDNFFPQWASSFGR